MNDLTKKFYEKAFARVDKLGMSNRITFGNFVNIVDEFSGFDTCIWPVIKAHSDLSELELLFMFLNVIASPFYSRESHSRINYDGLLLKSPAIAIERHPPKTQVWFSRANIDGYVIECSANEKEDVIGLLIQVFCAYSLYFMDEKKFEEFVEEFQQCQGNFNPTKII